MTDLSHVDTREDPPEAHSGLHESRPGQRLELPVVPAAADPEPRADSELHSVVHLVHEEFDDELDPRAVDETLKQVTARFDGAPIRVFVPLLVRRYAREELKTRLREVR